jgi:hypothetical protein
VSAGFLRGFHLTRCVGPLGPAKGRRGWLYRLIGHLEQLRRDGVQVQLVAEPSPERLDRLCRVVLASLESAIHDLLDAAAGWNTVATAANPCNQTALANVVAVAWV